MRPICPICRKPIREGDPIAMHEALLTRGDVMGLPVEEQAFIFHKCNIVLVHNTPGCHGIASTKSGQILCAQQILEYQGATEVTQWLQNLQVDVPDLPRTLWVSANSLVQELAKP